MCSTTGKLFKSCGVNASCVCQQESSSKVVVSMHHVFCQQESCLQVVVSMHRVCQQESCL